MLEPVLALPDPDFKIAAAGVWDGGHFEYISYDVESGKLTQTNGMDMKDVRVVFVLLQYCNPARRSDEVNLAIHDVRLYPKGFAHYQPFGTMFSVDHQTREQRRRAVDFAETAEARYRAVKNATAALRGKVVQASVGARTKTKAQIAPTRPVTPTPPAPVTVV